MRDHMCDGVPVAQLSTAQIVNLLREGFTIDNDDGKGEREATRMVTARLRLELDIRKMGLRK